MFLGKFLEESTHGPTLSLPGLIEATADSANALQQFMVVEQRLIGVGTLNHDLCLAIDGKDGWLPCFLELPNMLLAIALKVAEGVYPGEIEGHD